MPDPSQEQGELVETGTFRVDTGRMLEVLSRYQLQAPDQALRALVRCAVGAGASGVDIDRAAGQEGAGFALSFDGRQFSKEELLDIYSPLLSGAPGPGRYLAVALLALLKTAPGLLRLSSGGAVFSVAGAGTQALGGAAKPGRTELVALWKTEPPDLPLAKVLAFPVQADAALVCCPIPVRSPEGESRAFRERSEAGCLSFEKHGRRGVLAPLFDDGSAPVTEEVSPAASRVSLHASGVYVETVDAQLPPAPVAADVDDPALRLDASCSKCVLDNNFSELELFMRKQAGALLMAEMQRHREDMAIIGRLVKDEPYRRLWRARLGTLGDWQAAIAPPGPLARLWGYARWLLTAKDLADKMEELPGPVRTWATCIPLAGPRNWWLQDACRRALGNCRKDPGGHLLGGLWTTPLMLSTHGTPLSLGAIRARVSSARGGLLRVSKYFKGEAMTSDETVWLASFRDRVFLRAFVPEENWSGDIF